MKKHTLLTIAFLLFLLAGCSANREPVLSSSEISPTVADLFTRPTETAAPTEANDAEAPEAPTAAPVPERLSHGPDGERLQDEISTYYVYEGGELHIPYKIQATGFSQVGTGILVFVDGQCQPYRTSEEPDYTYMHTFYPREGRRTEFELIFTPVTGTEGDDLEVYFLNINFPEYFPSMGQYGWANTRGSAGAQTRIKFFATPPEQTLPQVPDRVLSWNISFEDLKSSEVLGWSDTDFRTRIQDYLWINGHREDEVYATTQYSISEDPPLPFKLELWGPPLTNYGLVIFLDNTPVSVEAEDLIFPPIESGKKTVIEAEIDLSGFDGSSVIYAVLVPRNYQSRDGLPAHDTYTFIQGITAFYLSSAGSYEEMMKNG